MASGPPPQVSADCRDIVHQAPWSAHTSLACFLSRSRGLIIRVEMMAVSWARYSSPTVCVTIDWWQKATVIRRGISASVVKFTNEEHTLFGNAEWGLKGAC